MRSVRVIADNDYFDFWLPPATRPDDNYTQGLKVAWDGSSVFSHARRLVCGTRPACGTSFEFGQEMYTPTTDAASPLPYERPYAGWLYGRFSVRSGDGGRLRTVGLTVGLTGPASLAEDAQVAFHRMVPGFRIPLGWSHQLANELAFAIHADQSWHFASSGGAGRIVDVVPSIALTFGTLRVAAGAGVRARVGVGLDHPWLAPFASGFISLYGFVGARGEAVAHDLFLNGNTFENSVHVERQTLVGEAEGGLGARVGRLAVEYRAVFRGREYKFGPQTHPYGSITLRWRL